MKNKKWFIPAIVAIVIINLKSTEKQEIFTDEPVRYHHMQDGVIIQRIVNEQLILKQIKLLKDVRADSTRENLLCKECN